MKKLIILISIFLVFVLSGCEKKLEGPKEEVYIVYTSDVHCGVEENLTLSSLKAYVDDLKSDGKSVILVDCGDYLQGSTLGTMSKGKYIVDLMNEMGYDVVTFGNHEFDYGTDRLAELMKDMKAQQVLGNVIYTGKKGNIFEETPSYIIMESCGVRIAFLGVLTPATVTSSTPAYFKEDGEYVYDFYSGNEGQQLYDRVQELVDKARGDGADYVVVLSHLGTGEFYTPYDAISLISHTSGIDVVLDGHSHSLIVEDLYPDREGKDVILSSVGTELQAAGTLIIDKEGNMQAMHMSAYDRKDEAIENRLSEIHSEIDQTLSEHITDTAFDLNIADENGIRMVRNRETNLGDFVTDALRDVLETDIAIENGGGIRNAIGKGEVTYESLLNVMPFNNNCISVYATGQQIVDALEFGAKNTEGIYAFDEKAVGEFGGFLQVSGLKYTIDTSLASPVLLDENNAFAGFDGEDRRVKDVFVLEDGEYVPIDLTKTYTVAGIEYLLYGGGDGNNIFRDCEAKNGVGIFDIDVLTSFAKRYGVEERYAFSDGRIIVE